MRLATLLVLLLQLGHLLYPAHAQTPNPLAGACFLDDNSGTRYADNPDRDQLWIFGGITIGLHILYFILAVAMLMYLKRRSVAAKPEDANSVCTCCSKSVLSSWAFI